MLFAHSIARQLLQISLFLGLKILALGQLSGDPVPVDLNLRLTFT
jgi:hypothetical protein